MPKNVKTIQVVGKKDNISVPLWLAFYMSVALSMESWPHFAKSKSPLQTNFHICNISGTSGSANLLTQPTQWYANRFQTISHVLIWKQLVTVELATNISLNIRISCSVTWSYLAHHTPLVNAPSSGCHLFPAEWFDRLPGEHCWGGRKQWRWQWAACFIMSVDIDCVLGPYSLSLFA